MDYVPQRRHIYSMSKQILCQGVIHEPGKLDWLTSNVSDKTVLCPLLVAEQQLEVMNLNC